MLIPHEAIYEALTVPSREPDRRGDRPILHLKTFIKVCSVLKLR